MMRLNLLLAFFVGCVFTVQEIHAQCTSGDVRLVGGSNQYEGRVEVCVNDQWGTVCDNFWGPEDATVVCRQLGFAYTGTAEALLNAAFGEGTVPVLVDGVMCLGSEANLLSCPRAAMITGNCIHAEDAGARCEPPCVFNGEIRLAGGNVPNEGRLEVCFNNQWGTVCDDAFEVADATVVCRELGYSTTDVLVFGSAFFGVGVGPVSLDEVGCRGTEQSIMECSRAASVSCRNGHAEDVGVRCQVENLAGQTCTYGDVRLVNGSNQYEGRVEVCINDQWGTVCNELWDGADATVICRQLGFGFISNSPTQVAPDAMFGRGSGDIVLDDVQCRGNENQILGCRSAPILTVSRDCHHDNDVGVICEAPCTTGQIRLANGNLPNIGRVEVCINNEWGTVCDDSFDRLDASVVCRQAGYLAGDAVVFGGAFFGPGTGSILLDEVRCTGTELLLTECASAPSVSCSRGHSEDVGVRCQVNATGTTCSYGDVRLVGGSNPYEGRVEVCINDQWGTVCDEGWDGPETTIVCRTLGYAYKYNDPAQAIPNAAFGQGTGPIVMDDVGCGGTENQILACGSTQLLSFTSSCGHDDDAGVRCEAPCTTGDIRLVNGNLPHIGRVEECINNEWGTVCDDSFDGNDASVVCRQLGYLAEDAIPFHGAFYGQGTGSILLDELRCVGNEQRLIDCPYPTSVSCSRGHAEDVGVRCQINSTGTTCTYGDVRLVGGSNAYEGRVEVCINDQWGTVCDESWDGPETTIVCRTLGYAYRYNDPAQAIPNAFFGQGTGPIVMDDVACRGTENQILACGSTQLLSFTSSCGHDDDAGVRCEAPCTTGDIRLVNGNLPHIGRVEVCINNEWGTVCDDSFDGNDASVVCRQLGYLSEDAIPFHGAFYGQGTGSILLDELRCVGNEQRLIDCPYPTSVSCSRGHAEDVGVRCQINSTGTICTYGDVRLVGGSNAYEGRVEVCINDQWGTVCDEGWDGPETTIVCRTLGYAYKYNDPAQAIPNAAFGQGTGPIVMDDVGCGGTENQILACGSTQLLSFTSSCGHDDDAGVRCEAPCTTGDIRLVNGNLPHIGRVEVCINNEWGTVCDDSFDGNDASVVCRQLGYLAEDAIPFHGAFYGQGTGSILLDELRCVGNEQRLIDCPYPTSVSCSRGHAEDVGVRCQINSTGNCSYGDVRLVNGSNVYEGRVEVCINDQWGTVCDESWDGPETTIVCRTLGYAYRYNDPAQAILNAFFGQGTGPIVMDDVACTGTENQILACGSTQLLSFTSSCGHDDDAGVRCEAPCTTGDIRLVNGNLPNIGRLEVCINNQWGTVCDDSFDGNDASVVCRQLGYLAEDAIPFHGAFYGQGVGSILLDELRCVGTEQRLIDCPYPTSVSCSRGHSEDVGVRCQINQMGTTCSYGEVRLVGGATPYEGRVEVCINNTWGTVCDENWNGPETSVVCRQLGYSFVLNDNNQAVSNGQLGRGIGPIVLNNMQCGGTENQLLACGSSQILTISHNCGHDDDAGVRCTAPCAMGDLRLRDGSLASEGRLEVCVNNEWGTVCDDQFAAVDASVACRQLGFRSQDAEAVSSSGRFGVGVGAIFLDELRCVGTEQRIIECPRSPTTSCSRGHQEDVGVRCEVTCSDGQLRLVGGGVPNEGRVEICISNDWGTLCDNSWNSLDANVVCRQLGYHNLNAVPFSNAHFGIGSGTIHSREYDCSGSENRLLDCPSSAATCTSHSDDAGVRCQVTAPSTTCTYGDVRLVGGFSRYEGRVEVCINDQWGTVCDEGWDNSDATVVCRQLGFSFSGLATSYINAFFGAGTGPIFLSDVQCNSTAERLLDCPSSPILENTCFHSGDAGIGCQASCSDGQLRLVGGRSPSEGRVEVCLNNMWGSVCATAWDLNDAMVVCRQIFGSIPEVSDVVAYIRAEFGVGSGGVYLNSVACRGDENRLTDCSSNNASCVSPDAGVGCSAVVVPTISTQPTGSQPTGSQPTGSQPTGSQPTGSQPTGSQPTGSQPTGSQPTGSQPTDSQSTDSTLATSDERTTEKSEPSVNPMTTSPMLPGGSEPLQCTHGEVRLQGTSRANEGRVEICINEDWHTVCDDSWDVLDATVVCRQLGFSEKESMAFGDAQYGAINGAKFINFVDCDGSERSLIACSSNSSSCTISEQAAGVMCQENETDSGTGGGGDDGVGQIIDYVLIVAVGLLLIVVFLLIFVLLMFIFVRRRSLKKNREHLLEYSAAPGAPMTTLKPAADYNEYDYGASVVENEYSEIQTLETSAALLPPPPPTDLKGKQKKSPDYKGLDSKGKRKKGFGRRKKRSEDKLILVDSVTHLKDEPTPIPLDSETAKQSEMSTPDKESETDFKEEKKSLDTVKDVDASEPKMNDESNAILVAGAGVVDDKAKQDRDVQTEGDSKEEGKYEPDQELKEETKDDDDQDLKEGNKGSDSKEGDSVEPETKDEQDQDQDLKDKKTDGQDKETKDEQDLNKEDSKEEGKVSEKRDSKESETTQEVNDKKMDGQDPETKNEQDPSKEDLNDKTKVGQDRKEKDSVERKKEDSSLQGMKKEKVNTVDGIDSKESESKFSFWRQKLKKVDEPTSFSFTDEHKRKAPEAGLKQKSGKVPLSRI